MSRKELETVLDYILNRADDAEFEVIQKACQRRTGDRGAVARLGGLGPKGSAQKMAQELQAQMGYSLEGMRSMVKGYVADIIRKNAPEISEEELAKVLDSYVPDPETQAREVGASLAESRIPPEALVSMVRQFVEYSEGRMAPSRQRELWEQMPRWQDEYWAAFPGEVKALVKGYLESRIDGETFGTALLSLLGL